MKEASVYTPIDSAETAELGVAIPTLEQFDGMMWLNKLRDVRELRDHRQLTRKEGSGVRPHDAVVALQENLCPSHALARIARVTRDAGKQYGEVWHMTAAGWICQKHAVSGSREKDQFLDYYLEQDVTDAPIEALLDEGQMAELEHTGFVATGIPVSEDDKNTFVHGLIINMQRNYRALDMDEPLERIVEELSLEHQEPAETVSDHTDELLDTFGTHWLVLATEPVASIRRTPEETIVGVNSTVISADDEPLLRMRYYRHDGVSLSVLVDEKRPVQDVFDREATDVRMRAWHGTDTFRPVRAHEAAYLAEYMHGCTNVASLLTDMQEAADSRLPDARSCNLGKMMPGALHDAVVRTVALTPKQIDAGAPSYMQMVSSDTGDRIDTRHVYMGYYDPQTNLVNDMQLSYHGRTGTVHVVTSTVSGMSAAEVARIYRDTSKPHRTATADTIRDVFRTPYGAQEPFYTDENNGRESRVFHALNGYDEALQFVAQWGAVTPTHASKRNRT